MTGVRKSKTRFEIERSVVCLDSRERASWIGDGKTLRLLEDRKKFGVC